MTSPVEAPYYSQGVCGDGAAILKDGVMLTIDEIVAELNALSAAGQGDEVERIGAVLFRDWDTNERSPGGPMEYYRGVIRDFIASQRRYSAPLPPAPSADGV
jgi:hypothetical protein